MDRINSPRLKNRHGGLLASPHASPAAKWSRHLFDLSPQGRGGGEGFNFTFLQILQKELARLEFP
jgi:hypothetical protein